MPAHFEKENRSRYPDQLLKEAEGLEALRIAAINTGLDVATVVSVDERTLTLPFITASPWTDDHWRRLGRGLAALHSIPQERFGFDHDNYIGLNPQPNGHFDSWGEFFLKRRLEFQVSLIGDQGLRRRFSQRLRQRGGRLREFLDGQGIVPSLLHGDLWNGNVLAASQERVWLIDPAVYRGDADADVAMTEMFGGFGPAFDIEYRRLRPPSDTWPVKRQIYTLYHYLNHLNLFGASYLASCEARMEALDAL